MLSSALIVLFAAHLASNRISQALVKAGGLARSHVAVPSVPSPLEVQLQEPSKPLESEDRDRFTQAFIAAITSKEDRRGRAVTEVVVAEMEAPRGARVLQLTGTLTYDGLPEPTAFESYLHADGFGGFSGFVRTKDGQTLLFDKVNVGT